MLSDKDVNHMKILIIDECFYTRSGVNTYLNS
ncbi:hypothetical protein YPPY58_2885, partial [Yersinia pestis PY-58]